MKMFLDSSPLALLICLAFSSLLAGSAVAQNPHAAAVAKYMTPDVVGVVYVDLARLDVDATLANAAKLGFQEQGEVRDLAPLLPVIKSEIVKLNQVGISRAYMLLRTSDIQSGGVSMVVPLGGGDSKAAKGVLSELIGKLQPKIAKIEFKDGALLASTSVDLMERLKVPGELAKGPRTEMWDAVGDGAMGVVLFGDNDSRKVIRELMPKLPAPFDGLTGELVADGIAWIGLELKLGQTPNLKIACESTSEGAAQKIAEITKNGFEVLKSLPVLGPFWPTEEPEFVLDALQPVRTGNRVSISTQKLTADMERLAKILAPQVLMTRQTIAKDARLNKMRQIVLAMHNWESAYKSFPFQGVVEPGSKQQLSWRVMILPFVEEGKLYNQFRLDEPWNSEHNLKLAQQMPKAFQDPDPKSYQNNQDGKTIYLGVAGEGMMFDGMKKTSFGDITDGSSNTIVISEVDQKHAVVWTKPSDWQVDLSDPTAWLHGEGRTQVTVGLGDGSVQRIPLETPNKTWRALLQIADGEVVGF
ncbi:MAG: hypothetical protein ACI87E_000216 [Mariniblastus sp.]|jgi:hypothetical protein